MLKKSEQKSSQSDERRLYYSPKLTSFGMVRDLTAGGQSGIPEPGQGVPPPKDGDPNMP